ncbi:MAG TPA: hypothetical protein VG735_13835 [Caulobacterales bacterium]|jgi:hypothetical protein|nr:hypothetical protein [Caulobacterales bacterium]
MLKSPATFAVFALLLLATPARGQTADWPPGPDRDLVQDKCTMCHVATQVTSRRLDADQWAEIVGRMVTTNGAVLSDDEFTRIVKYLGDQMGPPAAENKASANPANPPPAK